MESAGGDERPLAARAVPTPLTAQARALYESSVVPVREIARLVGVSERTLYKYVQKGEWRRRYRVVPRGMAAAAANRGRRMQPSPGFEPVRGTSARFVRREAADTPHASGLKALDPPAQAAALIRAVRAQELAEDAHGQALAQRDADARVRELAAEARALVDRHWGATARTRRMQQVRAARVPGGPGRDRYDPSLDEMRAELARRMHAMVMEAERAELGPLARPEPGGSPPPEPSSPKGSPPERSSPKRPSARAGRTELIIARLRGLRSP